MFGLSHGKDKFPLTEIGKIIGEAGIGKKKNQELNLRFLLVTQIEISRHLDIQSLEFKGKGLGKNIYI